MRRLTRLLRNPSTVVVANSGAQAAIRFVSNILLAQLLMPAAFALTSITLLITSGLQMVTDVGIVVMALRKGVPSEEEEARMWTMQVVRGFGLSIVLFLLGGPVGQLYNEPELAEVMHALSLITLVQGAQSLWPFLQLARQNLVPNLICEVGGRLLGAVVSILTALITPTVWALVTGILVQAVFTTLVGHVMAGRRPRFDFHFGFIREYWRFSRWIQLSSTMTFIALQADKAIFPFLYSLPRFAFYGIGANFALIPAQVTQKWSADVHYPLVVNKLKQGEQARDDLRRIRGTMLLYVAVITITMMLTAPDFFYLLYKPTYHEAGRFAQLLAAAVFFDVAESSLRHFPLVDRTPRYEFIAVLVRLSLFALLVGAIWVTGLDAPFYALAYTAAQAGSYAFVMTVCRRAGYARIGRDVLPTGAVLAAVAFVFLMPNAPGSAAFAFGHGMVFGLVGLALLVLIYRRRGLPSLPHEEDRAVPAPENAVTA